MQRLASSGRTSFPVDKEVPRTFYRTIGYRVCGERAVRVDILERLADLIRPALAWRPGSPAPAPAGAFEGIGFTVTQAMTSLTGSSGEDFASILRALGYRMEKRPKPAKPTEAEPHTAAETTAAAADQPAAGAGAPPETEVAGGGDAPPETEAAGDAPAQPEPVLQDAAAPETLPQTSEDASAQAVDVIAPVAAVAVISAEPGSEAPIPVETNFDPQPAEASAACEAPAAEPPAASEASASDDSASDDSVSDLASAAEPELVEVWRPGGRSDERRGQRRPPQWQRASHQGEAQRGTPDKRPPAEGAAIPAENGAEASAETAPAERKGRPHRRQRGAQSDFRRDREDGGERRQREHHAERQGERPERGRSERPHFAKGRGDGKDFAPRRERERQADPNSPFAKLAALKAQLEAAAKERR
jgi:ATP-dependent RNA helicase SUPV3L1/SUV3